MIADIWRIIAELCTELHPDSIGTLASKVKTLNSGSDLANEKANLGLGINEELVDRLAEAWKKKPELKGLEIAAALSGAVGVASLVEKRESVEMVWTGPFTGLVASRHTEQVLLEVIKVAKKRIFIVSYVVYDIDSVMQALQDAIRRNVKVDILLEPSKDKGGSVSADSVKVFSEHIPSANVYIWDPEVKARDKLDGAVHAKCVEADGEIAFITSANFTIAAMERNMELGVLVRGGILPDTLDRHLEALITTGVVKRV